MSGKVLTALWAGILIAACMAAFPPMLTWRTLGTDEPKLLVYYFQDYAWIGSQPGLVDWGRLAAQLTIVGLLTAGAVLTIRFTERRRNDR